MLLAIDIGNTNISIGVWHGRAWQAEWRILPGPDNTIDEYGIMLNALLRESGHFGGVTQVILCSVVPALTTTFAGVSRRYLGLDALIVNHTLDLGVTTAVDAPAEVGTDRLVNAVAAHHAYPGPNLIIDMGTATKLDLVSADGTFCGGVIAPGLGLAADSLFRRAAKLSRVALEAPPQVLGRNTVHAVQSGLVFGYVSLIEGLTRRLLAEQNLERTQVRVTGVGGLIHLIKQHTAVIDQIDPNLTLTGLRLINDRLRGNNS